MDVDLLTATDDPQDQRVARDPGVFAFDGEAQGPVEGDEPGGVSGRQRHMVES